MNTGGCDVNANVEPPVRPALTAGLQGDPRVGDGQHSPFCGQNTATDEQPQRSLREWVGPEAQAQSPGAIQPRRCGTGLGIQLPGNALTRRKGHKDPRTGANSAIGSDNTNGLSADFWGGHGSDSKEEKREHATPYSRDTPGATADAPQRSFDVCHGGPQTGPKSDGRPKLRECSRPQTRPRHL